MGYYADVNLPYIIYSGKSPLTFCSNKRGHVLERQKGAYDLGSGRQITERET